MPQYLSHFPVTALRSCLAIVLYLPSCGVDDFSTVHSYFVSSAHIQFGKRIVCLKQNYVVLQYTRKGLLVYRDR